VKPNSFIISILLVTALACSTTNLAENLVPSGGVLYQDFFSDPQSGWGELSQDPGSSGYINGAYHFLVNQSNTNIWSHPGKLFTDTHIEVSTMPVSGPFENQMGIICRLVNDQNFYFFTISSDGFFGIGKMINGKANLISNTEMQKQNAILTGNQINILRADCIGNTLTMYINNVLVSSVKDSEFSSGDVGILAGTSEKTGADIYFDNFMVFKP